MPFDAKTRYALLAALDLAAHYCPGQPVKVREIAARTGVPPKYLVHILLKLKARVLVNSTRGPKGGYYLVRPPEMISAAEIVSAVAGSEGAESDSGESPYDTAVAELWAEADRRRRRCLAELSLARLLAAAEE